MKESLKIFYKNLRFRLSANNSWLFIGFYRFFYSPSKGSVSEIIDKYSKSKPKGFTVIQIGANDGITHDPIHKFIKRDKWNGVLLEPQKEVFETYLSKIYKKDPVQVLNAALGEKDGSMNLYKIGFSSARWATGLASFDRSVLESAFERGYITEQATKEGIEIPDEPEKRIISEEIDTISVDSLLKRYDIHQIDFLQIDVEGFDFEVIKMFDVANRRPGLIIFESVHLSENDFEECIRHLNTAGYQSKVRGRNTIAMWEPGPEFKEYFA